MWVWHPLEVVHPGDAPVHPHPGLGRCLVTGHHHLAHLRHLGGLSLLIQHVADGDVVGLSWLEVVGHFHGEDRVVDREGELHRLCEHVLEGNADARAGSDDEGALWFRNQTVAVERDGVVPSARGGDAERALGVSQVRRFKGDVDGGLLATTAG